MTVTHPIGLSAPTLADPVIAEAAARFVDARRSATGLADFPGPLPADLATAYAIQATATAAWPDEVAGWKVARVPPALEETLGAMRYIGPIFAGTVVTGAGGPLTFPVIPGGFGAVEAVGPSVLTGASGPPATSMAAWTAAMKAAASAGL